MVLFLQHFQIIISILVVLLSLFVVVCCCVGGLPATTKLKIILGSVSGFLLLVAVIFLMLIVFLCTLLCSRKKTARAYMSTTDTEDCFKMSRRETEETEEARGVSNGHGNDLMTMEASSRVAADTATSRSWSWLRDCFRLPNCFRSQKEVSKYDAKLFVSHLKDIVEFGYSEVNIKPLLEKPGARDKIWPVKYGVDS